MIDALTSFSLHLRAGRRAALPSSLLAFAFALAACGGDDTESTASDATTTTDPTTSSSGTETTAGPTDSDGSESDSETTTSPTTSDPTTSETDPTTSDTDPTTSETDPTTDTDTDTDTDTTGPDIPPCPYTPVDNDPNVALEMVADGFTRPVFVTGHPTMPDTLYVVEQGGTIRILNPGDDSAPVEAFLDINVAVGPNEMGLLGFAFHPDFPDDPRFYVNYNPPSSDRTIISEFQLAGGDETMADPNSERIVMEFDQPFENHNGGMIEFGPDGYLYIATGDGGAANDPLDSGQDLNSILGKILRVDVEPGNGMGYTIPADNPFANMPGTRGEIWAYGLRNAWRFSHDMETGILYAGDVGQNQWEEVTLIEPGGNYGWNEMEGFHCFQGANCGSILGPNESNENDYIMPLVEYDHGNQGGQSITGGYVYRGCEVPAWQGRYYYADFVSNRIWALTWDGQLDDLGVVINNGPENPSSFGQNAWGDVYLTTFGGFGGGSVYRLAPG